MPSKLWCNAFCNWLCNIFEINKLRIAFENMPFLLQEGRFQCARGACIRTQKGLFLLQAQLILDCRREQSVKYIDILCLHSWHYISHEGPYFLSQKYTEKQNTQVFTEILSQPIPQNVTANRSLTPSPSPNGEGSDHRDTPPCPPDVQRPISYQQQAKRGNLTYYSPLHSERGWG